MSRSISADLLMRPTGWRVSTATSRIERVILYSFSIGRQPTDH